MPLVQVNAHKSLPFPAAGGDLQADLARALHDVPPGAPVVILLHGFKFSPFRPGKSPHGHILSLTPDRDTPKVISWPRHLGFSGTRPDEGLCIAFGWEASGHIWRAYGEAARAGAALARLTAAIRTLRPGQQVDLLAHSLGARVALSALPHMAPGTLRRAILMAPAELSSRAGALLDTPAGHMAEFLNVTSRENDLFDFLLEGVIVPHRPRERSLGHNAPLHPNWCDLQIDHADTLETLARLGHRIAPPARRVCHWSPYLRPGMFGLYRAFLDGSLPLAALPRARSPRWSRLLAPPRTAFPLPFAGKAPS
ncbi:alpha/beta hydrolase [Actibacterium sp. D379-3]